MQKEGGSGWSLLVWGLPIAALGFGVFQFYKKGSLTSTDHSTALPTKSTPKTVEKESPQNSIASTSEAEPEPIEDKEVKPTAPAWGKVEKIEKPREFSFKTTGDLCAQKEFRGLSPHKAFVVPDQWSKVMKLYHEAKSDVRSWITQMGKNLSEETRLALIAAVQGARIQRPPSLEEPDISWRGLVFYTRDSGMQPIIRVGFGFLDLVDKEPDRARFELARVISQGLSPCELKKAYFTKVEGLEKVWNPVLSCFGFDPIEKTKSCEKGNFSEEGWAVATTVAAWASPANCVMPSLNQKSVALCLKSKSPFLDFQREPAQTKGVQQ